MTASRLAPAAFVLLCFALALNALTAVDASFALRPLYNEGVHWFFRILDVGQPYFNFSRYADVLLQLPTLLATRLAPDHVSGWALLQLFCLPYALQPLLLTLAAVAYIIHKKRPELAAPCLISYAVVTQPASGVVQMIVPQSLGYFWIAFFMLHLGDFRARSSALVFGAVLVLLAMTHETAILALALLGTVVISRLRRGGRNATPVALMALIAILAAWILLRAVGLLGHDPAGSNNFVPDFWHAWDIYRWYSASIIFLVSAAMLLTGFGRRTRWAWIATLLLATVLTFYCSLIEANWISQAPWRLYSFHHAADARTTALLFATALASVIALLEYRGKARKTLGGDLGVSLAAVGALALFFSASQDSRLTRRWNEGLSSIRQIVDASPPGCQVVSETRGFRGWATGRGLDRLPLYSIALQASRVPSKVLFGEEISVPRPCEDLRARRIFASKFPSFPLTCASYLDCARVPW